MVWIWSLLEVILEYFRGLARGRFFMYFLEAPFSVPGRLLGAQGAQKGAKMIPKSVKIDLPRRSGGCAGPTVITV